MFPENTSLIFWGTFRYAMKKTTRMSGSKNFTSLYDQKNCLNIRFKSRSKNWKCILPISSKWDISTKRLKYPLQQNIRPP